MSTKDIRNSAETAIVRKAKLIASKGWVRRADGHFVVREAERNSRYFIVERERDGAIRCSCPMFKSLAAEQPDLKCLHMLAVRYAISLKNTEHPAPFPLTGRPAAMPPIKITESCTSERGEQKSRNTSKEVSELRHIGGVDLHAFRLKQSRGTKEMKQELASAAVAKTSVETPQDNILDFSRTLRELRGSVDQGLVRQRESRTDRSGNTHVVDYVEWHTVADILDTSAPNWTHSVKDIRTIGELIAVTVSITINGVTREGIGTGPARSETGIKKAEHDALKRAAVKFGIARDLYKREIDQPETDRVNEDVKFPANPIALNLSDIITGKQLRMIRAIGRERGIDTETECTRLMNCGVNELSKRAASALIDHLQNFDPMPAEVPMRRAG